MLKYFFLPFSKDWIRTSLRLHHKIPPHRPSSPPEASAPVLTSHLVMMKLSRWPFPPQSSRVLSYLSRRFVLSHTRLHSTETRSLTYLTLTHEPFASFEKRTVNTWPLMDSQTLQEGWRDLTPQQWGVPARKWSSSRVLSEHKEFRK